jgi:hypothetical protein
LFRVPFHQALALQTLLQVRHVRRQVRPPLPLSRRLHRGQQSPSLYGKDYPQASNPNTPNLRTNLPPTPPPFPLFPLFRSASLGCPASSTPLAPICSPPQMSAPNWQGGKLDGPSQYTTSYTKTHIIPFPRTHALTHSPPPSLSLLFPRSFSSVSRNALCVLFSLLSLLACVMLGVHTYLAATGQTTYQLIMRERDMMSRRARHPGRGPQHRDSQPGSDPSALADSQQSQLRGVRVVAATHAPDMGIGGLGVVGGAGGAGGGPRQGDDGGEWSGGGGCASCCSGVCGAGPQWSESKWDEGVCNNLAAFARGATRREWRVGLLEDDYRAIKQQSEQGRAGQRGRF